MELWKTFTALALMGGIIGVTVWIINSWCFPKRRKP